MIDVTYEPQQPYVPPTGNCKNDEEEFVQLPMEEKKDDFYDDMLLIGLITIALIVAFFTIATFEGETTFKDTPSFKDATTFTGAEQERLTHAREESFEDSAYLNSTPEDLPATTSSNSNLCRYEDSDEGREQCAKDDKCFLMYSKNCHQKCSSFDTKASCGNNFICEFLSNKCVLKCAFADDLGQYPDSLGQECQSDMFKDHCVNMEISGNESLCTEQCSWLDEDQCKSNRFEYCQWNHKESECVNPYLNKPNM